MLAKSLRFHGHGSLRYLYKNADTYRSRYFTLRITKNSRRKKSRFAVVVSKKTHKSAVGRNRMRRRTYEILRHEMDRFSDTYDIAIIITSGEVMTADHVELERAVVGLFNQAGVYK